MSMRIVVTGADGQLGRCLTARASNDPQRQEALSGPFSFPSEWILKGLGRQHLDICDAEAVTRVFRRLRPDVVINAAAWTDVEAAERDVTRAMAVNALGAANIAAAATSCGARLLHLSTDYVFDGTAAGPIVEIHPPSALNVYGASKLAGEVAVQREAPDAVIVRTSWLYSRYRPNFVTTVLQRAAQYQELAVVDDQTGCPTWAGDLADAIFYLVQCGDIPAGLYHYAGQDAMTWHAFACKVIEYACRHDKRWAGVRVRPVRSGSSGGAVVPRPAYSVLSCEKIKALGVCVHSLEERLEPVVASVLQEA